MEQFQVGLKIAIFIIWCAKMRLFNWTQAHKFKISTVLIVDLPIDSSVTTFLLLVTCVIGSKKFYMNVIKVGNMDKEIGKFTYLHCTSINRFWCFDR
jgi:hypothetical protein